MQNFNMKSSFICSLMKSNGVVLGWLPDEGSSPFAEKLWHSLLAEAASSGELKMSGGVIEATLLSASVDCLFSRRRRRELLDAFVSIVPIINGGEELLIKSILEFHQESVSKNGDICRLGKYHDVLYVAVSLAAKFQISNDNLISNLLESIFSCEQSFDRLVAPAILGPKVSHILSSWRPDIENAEKALSDLSYFVSHTNSIKLQFGKKENTMERRRFLDVPLISLQETPPITVAVQANDPKAVKMLLQNGVELGLYGVWCPLRTATQKLSTFANSYLAVNQTCECSEETRHLMHQRDTESFETQVIHQTKPPPHLAHQEWANVLYAATFFYDPAYTMCDCERNFKIPWPEDSVKILRLISDCVGRKKVFYNPEFFHPKLFADGLFNLNPPPLKHFSRLVIRQTLRENWKLPSGIYDLHLPQPLLNYLNLEE